jgi:predicted enzyme related to lactoylglutathione lyase
MSRGSPSRCQTRGKLVMSNADIRGKFVWHELMTTDPDSAGDFYTSIVPWKMQPSGMPGYTLWMSGATREGGLMGMPEGEASGTPPHWIVYIGTPDVDATVAAALKLGGKVLKSASDIPDVGRFAVLADPHGAAFAAFSPMASSSEAMPDGGAVGDFVWHELTTLDLNAALEFYGQLFGWQKGETHDMGAMGVYQIIAHGGKEVGGLWKARDATSPPNWLSYVRVPDVAKVATAVKAGGGRVLHGPVEVPGGSWIVMLLDPQGGAFAVVEGAQSLAKPAKPPAAKKKTAAASSVPKTPKPAKALPATSAAKPASKPSATPVNKKAKKKTAAKKSVAAKSGLKGKKALARKAPKKKAVAKRSSARKTSVTRRTSTAERAVKRAKRAAPKSSRGKGKKKGTRR